MQLNLKSIFFLFVLIILFSLLIPQKIFAFKKKNIKTTYAQLIQTYKKYLKLENEVFEMLSFKYSLSQPIKDGTRLKFTLEDNLGKKWIFKPDYLKKQGPKRSQGIAAAIVYQVYKLFGVNTPRTHFTTLNINDKKISGSMQEYVKNKGTLLNCPPSQVSPEILNYLLQSQVLDWLLANHDTNRKHFLITSLNFQNKPKKVIRIDNDAALFLLDNDELRYDWKSHHFTKISSNYYFRIWQSYLLNQIDLNISKNLIFINFITNFPNDFFISLILPIKIHNFKKIPQSELKIALKNHTLFLETLLLRKNNLTKDFENFYQNLAEKKRMPFNPHKDISTSKLISSTVKLLTKEIKNLKKTKSQLETTSKYSSHLNMLFSFEGFSEIRKVYYTYWKEEKNNLTTVCNNALEELYSLKKSSKNKYEKEALDIYIKDIINIRSGEPAIFRFDEINKIIP